MRKKIQINRVQLDMLQLAEALHLYPGVTSARVVSYIEIEGDFDLNELKKFYPSAVLVEPMPAPPSPPRKPDDPFRGTGC